MTAPKTNKDLLIEYAKAWNNLDSTYIENLLSDTFEYTSQWVFSTITNKKDYLQYLDKKLAAIKASNGELIAELGLYDHKHCLVLTQKDDDILQKVTLLVETKDGKLMKAITCMIPEPESINMLGLIPK